MPTEPKFVLSKSKAIEQFNIVRNLGTVSYSLKTNYEVGKVLEENTDSMFSIHSLNNLNFIKDKGRAWFFLQACTEEDLGALFDSGVRNYVADNINDLNALLRFIGKTKININLLLRMRMKEHTIHTGKHFVFGFYSDKINELIPVLRKNSLIENLGIHFHRKTQNVSEWNLKEELMEGIFEKNFGMISIVNIGGGIPYKYKNFRIEVLDYVFGKIKELKSFLESKRISLVIEPGRFIAAPSVKLEAEIIGVYDHNIIVNCSVYNSSMDTLVYNIRLLVEGELDEGKSWTIKGCTPDSMDIFRYNVFLNEPKVGDKIVFLNAGAYNFWTDFCGLNRIKTVIAE